MASHERLKIWSAINGKHGTHMLHEHRCVQRQSLGAQCNQFDMRAFDMCTSTAVRPREGRTRDWRRMRSSSASVISSCSKGLMSSRHCCAAVSTLLDGVGTAIRRNAQSNLSDGNAGSATAPRHVPAQQAHVNSYFHRNYQS